jgi:uncharacterized membrane protein (UPF0127 family)
MERASTLIPVWLVSRGHVLAAAQLATTSRDRRKGLLKTTESHEPLVIENCRWVHSIGMAYALDVAFLDVDNNVIAIHRLPRWRVGRPVRHAHTVIESRAGSFERWALAIGDVVEVRHVEK